MGGGGGGGGMNSLYSLCSSVCMLQSPLGVPQQSPQEGYFALLSLGVGQFWGTTVRIKHCRL